MILVKRVIANCFRVALILGLCRIASCEYSVKSGVLASGGSVSTSGAYSTMCTVGQPTVGLVPGDTLASETGFWYTGASLPPTVPIISVQNVADEIHIYFENIGAGTYRLFAGASPESINMAQAIAFTTDGDELVDPAGISEEKQFYVVTHSNP